MGADSFFCHPEEAKRPKNLGAENMHTPRFFAALRMTFSSAQMGPFTVRQNCAAAIAGLFAAAPAIP